MSSNFEKYLAGVPLNEELAALKAGRLPEYETNFLGPEEAGPLPVQDDPEKPLDREERIALHEMRVSRGWAVLQKLLNRLPAQHRREALRLSEDDPLASGSSLPNSWLNVKAAKQMVAQFNWSVLVELESLEESNGPRTQIESPL